MLRSLIVTAGAAVLLIPAASAQHDDHEGHDHSQHAQQPYNGPLSAAPQIDHVYTEAPDDHVIGADNAPTTIIAYASVTCPHCSKWFIEEWPIFKKDQIDSGNVRFILREYPTSPQNLAEIGFIIASCAPKDEYFDNLIYQMQSQKEIFAQYQAGKQFETYDALAARAGMKDDAAIEACFVNPAGNERIERAVARAHAGNINSVPSFFLDGVQLSGDVNAANLDAAITAKLKSGLSSLPKPGPKVSK